MFKITSCVLVWISLLAGCSGQRHPGEEDLKKQLASIDPELLEVESVTVQYSPMKEVFGTTLREGSLQAVCKVSAKTRRDLYVEIDPSSAKSTEDQNVVKWQLRARAIDNTRFGKTSRSLEGQELEEFQRVYDRVEKEDRGSVL